MWQMEKLQRQSDELRDEREGLLRDIDMLKEALEKAKDRGEKCNISNLLTVPDSSTPGAEVTEVSLWVLECWELDGCVR